MDTKSDALFDNLLETIGNDGYFQKRFNWIFNMLLVVIMAMSYMNLIMALSVPEHHCHVPGRNQTNYTLDEWHRMTLPQELNAETGEKGPSFCKIYKNGQNETETCFSWDYDQTWYEITAPSENNWVCKNEIYVANTYATSRIGETIGAILFGQLGDRIGRKPVYFISVALLLIGRVLFVFTSNYYEWFLFFTALSSTSGNPVFQTPLVIGMEVSGEKGRTALAFTQCVGWTAGISILPLLTWWLRDWKIVVLATTIPSAAAFIFYKMMPESPRWMASRGNVQGALRVLDNMAKTNSKKLPENSEIVLKILAAKKETTYGIASLFANWRLAKNSVLLIFCWMISGLTYFCLILNITNMAGNPFINFFWQSLAELPGYALAKFLCSRIGRRWTHTASYGVSVVLSLLVIVTYGWNQWLSIALVCFIKMCQTAGYYSVLLQSMEVYPTCIRQTGTSVGSVSMNVAGILGPYIIFTGDAIFPFEVLLGLGVIGAIFSSFIPETLGKKLPETLEDSKTFGMDQKFCSLNTDSDIITTKM